MNKEAEILVGEGEVLYVGATDEDVRLSLLIDRPDAGCPSGHHWSIPVDAALNFAEGILQAARKIERSKRNAGRQ